jgi:hypothetical protein
MKVNMSEVPGYEGPAYPLSCLIAPLTAVNAPKFNHLAVGTKLRKCFSPYRHYTWGPRHYRGVCCCTNLADFLWLGPQRDRVF